MSNCQCCLKPHPKELFERYQSSIETMKFLLKTCAILEDFLLEKHEYFERFSSNLNRYLMRYGRISNRIVSSFSQLIRQMNLSLENLTKNLYELECLSMKCSSWLRNSSKKSIFRQIKSLRKQFQLFEKKSNFLNNQFLKDFANFQTKYHQQCLQMDRIEYEHMKLVFDCLQFFSSIFSFDNPKQNLSMNDILQWNEENKIQLPWLSNEHLDKSLSNLEIKPLETSSNQDKYAIKSNLSWSFTQAEDLQICSFSPSTTTTTTTTTTEPAHTVPNRVRLAIEAIERNNNDQEFPRRRKS